jgi:mRNA interferase RelE/StbE
VSWTVRLTKRAARELRSIPNKDIQRVENALVALRDNPLSGDIRMLRGTGGVLRKRVGSWRVFFEIEEETVFVLRIVRRTTTTYRR